MKYKWLLVILSLQTAWILGTAIFHETRLASGRVVRLETVPVDPRDFLRGDYVVLRYKISSIPDSLFVDGIPDKNTKGKTVYVLLRPSGRYYEVAKASMHWLDVSQNEVLIKGQLSESRITYGIERYYVPEGTGNPTGKITVDVALGSAGQASIKAVYINDRPYGEVMSEHKVR